MKTVAEALDWGRQQMGQASPALTETAAGDSQWLMAWVLQRNSTWLRAWPEHELSAEQWVQFESSVERRCAGEPVAYITGRQGFWTLDLSVNQHTLVPRPDTELLVELALGLLDHHSHRVMDMGTGSGAIALALKSERPNWQLLATDISEAALAVAASNAQRFNLEVEFVHSAWFESVADTRFHMIVSNPPYIESDDPHLSGPGVAFEPMTALVSGKEGLDAIREIATGAVHHLLDGAWLLLEHGYNQGAAVRQLLLDAGFQKVATHQDYGHNDRVTLGQWHSPAS